MKRLKKKFKKLFKRIKKFKKKVKPLVTIVLAVLMTVIKLTSDTGNEEALKISDNMLKIGHFENPINNSYNLDIENVQVISINNDDFLINDLIMSLNESVEEYQYNEDNSNILRASTIIVINSNDK